MARALLTRWRIYAGAASTLTDGDCAKAARSACDAQGHPEVNFEDFLLGPDIDWFMSHDEVHYFTPGSAEIIAYSPPLHRAETRVVARPVRSTCCRAGRAGCA